MEQGADPRRSGGRAGGHPQDARNRGFGLPGPRRGQSPGAGRGNPAGEEAGSMQQLLIEYESELRAPRVGEILEGTVVAVDRDGITVDVGLKSEGQVVAHEVQTLLGSGRAPRVGETVFAFVVSPENAMGHALLSLERARSERGWRTVEKAAEDGRTLEAEVTDVNRGGLVADVEGAPGFIPMSQVMGLRADATPEETEARLASRKGEKIQVKVIEAHRRRGRLVLSERLANQERRAARKDELIEELRDGEIRRGVVASIAEFGVFVDVGGADGLVHLSEMSWTPLQNPGDLVKIGDEVDVMILNVNREKKKISLSMRRTRPEPWQTAADRYLPGQVVTGRITKLMTFGAFARIDDGLEGLIHISEMADRPITHPKQVVNEGDVKQMRILRIEPGRRRLGLSLRDIEQDQPSAASDGYAYTTSSPDEPTDAGAGEVAAEPNEPSSGKIDDAAAPPPADTPDASAPDAPDTPAPDAPDTSASADEPETANDAASGDQPGGSPRGA